MKKKKKLVTISLTGGEVDKLYFTAFEVWEKYNNCKKRNRLKQQRLLFIMRRLFLASSIAYADRTAPVGFYKSDLVALRQQIPWAYDSLKSPEWKTLENKLDKALDEIQSNKTAGLYDI